MVLSQNRNEIHLDINSTPNNYENTVDIFHVMLGFFFHLIILLVILF